MVLASLVFLLTFRRPRALLAVLPPLAAGTLWTTALAALVYPRLSAIATAFAAVVIGVGVDTGVHVYGRLLAARREGRSPSEAAEIARSETWRPTLGAALAAGGAFACLGLSDIAGMRQLGVLCAAGEVLTAVAILLVVPEVGAWLERGPPPRELRLPFVVGADRRRGRARSSRSRRAWVPSRSRSRSGAPTIDHGVVALDARVLPAAGVYDEIYATFGGTRGQLLVVSADADEARARARSDAVAEVAEKLAAERRHRGLRCARHDRAVAGRAAGAPRSCEMPSICRAKRALLTQGRSTEEGFAPDAFEPALEAFAHPAEGVTDVAASDDPATRVGEATASRQGREAARSPSRSFASRRIPRRRRRRARGCAPPTPRRCSPASPISRRRSRTRCARDLPRVLAGGDRDRRRRPRRLAAARSSAIALAVLVLVVEIAIVLLLSRVLGVRWHVYDALVLPVLLGITLDEALFLLEAAQRKARSTRRSPSRRRSRRRPR